jgi:hypothetical protein
VEQSAETAAAVIATARSQQRTAASLEERLGAVPPLAEAKRFFWISGLAVTLGLMLSGIAPASLRCCLCCPPAAFHLLGFPLRCRRGQRIIRRVYAVTGLSLVGYGIKLMLLDGGLGSPRGDLLLTGAGFAMIFVGLAAVSGASVQWMTRSLLPSSRPGGLAHPTTSNGPDKSKRFNLGWEGTQRYEDRQLLESKRNLPPELRRQAEALEVVAFEHVEGLAYQDGPATRPVLIEIGCQDTVFAEIESMEDRVISRLVSVLHDGTPVITLSKNYPVEREMCFGTGGQYIKSHSEDPIEMLSMHLEQAIATAEEQGTSVVRFAPREATDVAHLASRVMADLRRQFENGGVEVEAARYGRFSFPAEPVSGRLGLESRADMDPFASGQTTPSHPPVEPALTTR